MSSQLRLPVVLDAALYESKVLQLSLGQTERAIDKECEEDAGTLGLDLSHLQVPYWNHSHYQGSNVSLDQSLSSSRSRTSQLRRSGSTDTASLFHDCYSPTAGKSPILPNCETWRPDSPVKITGQPGKLDSPCPSPRVANHVPSSQEDYFQKRDESTSRRPILRKLSGIRQAFVRLPIFKRSRSQNEQEKYSGCELCPLYEPLDLSIFQLSCQHSYCTHHIQQIILSASQAQHNMPMATAQCCGQPIPDRLISAVTEENEDARPSQSMQSSLANDVSSYNAPRTEQQIMVQDLDRAMTYPDFRLIRSQQESERDRFLDFYKAQKNTLSVLHDAAFYELVEYQAKETDDMKTNLCQELKDLEDKQLAAEMEQHELHKDERSKVDIALKHMERYFQSNGALPFSSSCSVQSISDQANLPTQHKPSQRDLLQLTRQRWLRDNLEHRQESAINVIRGQQTRALRLRREKQRVRLASLGKEQEDAQRALDKVLEEEDEEFERVFSERKLRLVRRWNVSVAVWANKWNESGVRTPGQIAGVEWPSI